MQIEEADDSCYFCLSPVNVFRMYAAFYLRISKLFDMKPI